MITSQARSAAVAPSPTATGPVLAAAAPARIGAANASTHPATGSQSSSVKHTTSPRARRTPSFRAQAGPRPSRSSTTTTSTAIVCASSAATHRAKALGLPRVGTTTETHPPPNCINLTTQQIDKLMQFGLGGPLPLGLEHRGPWLAGVAFADRRDHGGHRVLAGDPADRGDPRRVEDRPRLLARPRVGLADVGNRGRVLGRRPRIAADLRQGPAPEAPSLAPAQRRLPAAASSPCSGALT